MDFEGICIAGLSHLSLFFNSTILFPKCSQSEVRGGFFQRMKSIVNSVGLKSDKYRFVLSETLFQSQYLKT